MQRFINDEPVVESVLHIVHWTVRKPRDDNGVPCNGPASAGHFIYDAIVVSSGSKPCSAPFTNGKWIVKLVVVINYATVVESVAVTDRP